MDYNELIKKHTTEEGINTEELAKDFERYAQDQTDGAVIKTKNKYKTRLSETEKELQGFQNQIQENDDSLSKVEQLMSEINSINSKLEIKEKQENFVKKANENGIPEHIYAQLINSGADLDKVDLTVFKMEKPASVPDLGTKVEEKEPQEEIEKRLLKVLKFKK